jgi:DNA-3-methyladenine glycosylase II
VTGDDVRGKENCSTLSNESYDQGISELVSQDSDLADVVSRWGNPPLWTHAPGFAGIVMAILAQQVSLESAKAAFTKLENSVNSVDPGEFLSLDDAALRAIGFSHQKASYVRGIARGIMAGEVRLDDLASMENAEARKSLMELRGIGAWTADTYLLFALRRQDVWPSGDLALAKAIQELRNWVTIPSYDEVDRIADDWRPWRAVAARILWHHYLCERGRG